MMRSSYRLCSVTATRHSVGCRGATTRLLAMATLTAMSAPLCGSSSLQPCRSFATTARCHQAKTPITRSSPKITKLVKKRRLSSPSIPPKTTKVTPRTMSKRSSFMSKMRQRDPSPENGTATMQKPVVPATVAAAEQSGMVDDVGAADAQLAEQDAMHADVDDDDCPELAPSTSPDVGEAEAEELAGEIHEVADVATDIGEEATAETAAVETRSQHVPSIGSILDMESPLNLRLATLTRQHGKSFRAIAVYLPMTRTNMNFKITFEDIASQARLVCHLDEVKTMYFEWIAQFRSCYVALFVPTLQHTNATLLQNAILTAKPSRPPPPSGSYHPRLNDDPDHLIFSYAKMREIVAKKKKEETINTQLLTVTVLNAYAEEWRNFISTPMSCVPQSFFLANFNFSGKDNVLLNKELLHSQISVAADCLVAQQQYLSATSGSNTQSAARPFGTGNWSLIFVSTPPRTSAGTSAIPPMQDLLSGHFVDPLSLSERSAVYIIGSGDAALSLSCFPAARKGRVAYSIMLQDIESQLNMQRPHRDSLTMILAKAVEGFSRLTWMGLMKAETQERRKPHPVHAFYRLERRGVQREVIPSFLDGVFAPNPSQPVLRSTTAPPSGGSGNRPHHNRGGSSIQSLRHLEEYVNGIFCNADRLAQETNLRDSIVKGQVFFVHIQTAGITAARRADNPFSARNGIIFAMTQHWSSMGLMNPPTVTQLKSTHKPSGEVDRFVEVDEVIPSSLPTGPPDAPNPRDRACSAVLVAWDAKRVLLHLHKSTRLQQFLRNGGRVWCAQYAQYLLKGFSPNNLATMERTLVQYHDGPLKSAMQPLAKLKLIFSTQVDISVNTRQLTSLVHRMDGLLASAEMEMNGLQVVPQKEVNAFAEKLRLDHERLEKVLQEKIMDFTADMDGEVRKRINFRSPQDISSIIYGGAVCRHLSSRFVPVRPMRLPITSFFPHAVAQATGTPLPADYLKPTALLAAGPQGGSAGVVDIRPADVERAVRTLQAQCRHVTMDQLLASTAIVVLIARSKLGEFLEQFSLYCPTSTDAKAKELNFRVAIDDVLPVADKADIVTVTQLKELIRNYPPLLALRKNNAATAGDKRGVGRTPDLRNLLILTNCVHDRLEPLVDTGIISALEETVLGAKPTPPSSLVERVCFAEVKNALPPTPGSGDSFETDFDLLTNTDSVGFSARSTWEAHAKDIISHQGLEGAIQAMCKHSASLLGTPRDVFRSTHPIPSTSPQGIHGQEQASTSGMLWQVTPPHLHSLLKRFLKGRAASSGAEAMERVTVLLSPHKGIDLSFFSSLQQLRFTEKKLQLFEEGCLFRAVLPECNDRVHGELCHCVTATGRLSSQSPNLQNIPKEEDLRRLLVSRFGPAGRMVEADYSQLEVVVLAALSRDAKMIEEIKDKVDFHCMRVSLMRKEPYADVVRKAKVLKDPEYIQLRQQAKVFSFQRQYGAGVMTIATTTGLSEQEVESLIAAEEQHYKELGQYYTLVSDCVEAGADRLLRLRSNDASQWPASLRRVVMLTEPLHYFVAPTGSKFDFGKDRKSIPRLKNYPVQGLAGEIVQVMCGKVLREFYRKRNYNNRAFLVNTVHDCVWVDAHASVADEVKADLHRILRETQQVIGGLWPEMKLDVPFNAEVHVGKSLGDMSS